MVRRRSNASTADASWVLHRRPDDGAAKTNTLTQPADRERNLTGITTLRRDHWRHGGVNGIAEPISVSFLVMPNESAT